MGVHIPAEMCRHLLTPKLLVMQKKKSPGVAGCKLPHFRHVGDVVLDAADVQVSLSTNTAIILALAEIHIAGDMDDSFNFAVPANFSVAP